MTTIWKFPLAITDEQPINVPSGFVPLSVQMQNRELCLWAKVKPGKTEKIKTVYVVGTGNPMPSEASDAVFVGTVQNGPFVWHVFIAG